jgi:uncharacterized protein
MPQEIEVWYIIPAIRRELAKSMIDDIHLTQKEVAKHMDLTEAAVSQYLSSKRAKDVLFTQAVLDEIKKAAKNIVENDVQLIPQMLKLCNLTAVKQVMCDIHKKQDVNLPDNCDVCIDEDPIKIKK